MKSCEIININEVKLKHFFNNIHKWDIVSQFI